MNNEFEVQDEIESLLILPDAEHIQVAVNERREARPGEFGYVDIKLIKYCLSEMARMGSLVKEGRFYRAPRPLKADPHQE